LFFNFFGRKQNMQTKHPFEEFLETFVPQVARKTRQAGKALWLLETTGSMDAADLKAELDAEYRMLFNDRKTYDQLVLWNKDDALKDPLLKRQLNVLIRSFRQNLIPKELLEEISQKETALAQAYATFRPKIDGKALSENDIREILKTEEDPAQRKKVWEASKEIGQTLAPQILALVALRNKAAQSLCYRDYFQMQLDLQEVDAKWLLQTFEDLARDSDAAYSEVIRRIEQEQMIRFKTSENQLGPWAWNDPFSQEDPLDAMNLDQLVDGLDLAAAGKSFYQRMGIDIDPILKRSDMYERDGKNQHAFCINIDRSGDIRTLNNVKSSIKWLETVLHELGHAIYEIGFDDSLPWLLREPPHMITTEAMALIAGRQAYRFNSLSHIVGRTPAKEMLMHKAEERSQRGQLIFSRWAMVMTHFESELYRDPSQDLNALWWSLVERYQKVRAPKDRAGKCDWAAKYHIGLAPVYYYSYLLGEMFASSIEEALLRETGAKDIATEPAGRFLQQKLFKPGNRMHWNDLVKNVTGEPLKAGPWLNQFGGNLQK